MERSTRMQLWKDMDGGLTEKQAELGGTYDMPWSPSDRKKNEKPEGEKAVIQKTAGITEDDILKMAFGSDNKPEDNEEETVEDENIEKQPQPKTLKPTVDVTSHEPPKLVTEKKASRYALPSQGRYPLDGYNQVKMASAYFDEWHKRMTPEMRREFCQNMVPRADELGIAVSPLAACYGSNKYASAGQIEMSIDARRTALISEDDLEVLDKVAAARPTMLPDNFASLLSEFDRVTGLDQYYDGDIPDPFFSVLEKRAEDQESETDPKSTIIVGNEYLTKRDLILFAKIGRETVKDRFGEEFADEFAKDPTGIFGSLPRDQKLVLMRMASSVDAQNQSASKS